MKILKVNIRVLAARNNHRPGLAEPGSQLTRALNRNKKYRSARRLNINDINSYGTPPL